MFQGKSDTTEILPHFAGILNAAVTVTVLHLFLFIKTINGNSPLRFQPFLFVTLNKCHQVWPSVHQCGDDFPCRCESRVNEPLISADFFYLNEL